MRPGDTGPDVSANPHPKPSRPAVHHDCHRSMPGTYQEQICPYQPLAARRAGHDNLLIARSPRSHAGPSQAKPKLSSPTSIHISPCSASNEHRPVPTRPMHAGGSTVIMEPSAGAAAGIQRSRRLSPSQREPSEATSDKPEITHLTTPIAADRSIWS